MSTATLRPLLVSPDEAAKLLSVGRSTIYDLIASGALRSLKIGSCRRIRLDEVEAFIEAAA